MMVLHFLQVMLFLHEFPKSNLLHVSFEKVQYFEMTTFLDMAFCENACLQKELGGKSKYVNMPDTHCSSSFQTITTIKVPKTIQKSFLWSSLIVLAPYS